MVTLFGRTGPVIWNATIDNIKNTGYKPIDRGTPVTQAYGMAKEGYDLILLDNSKPIGVLEFFQISQDDLKGNKTVGELKYSPVDIKDRETKVGEAYNDLEKGNVILVMGAENKITGVVTMSDYAKKRFI